MRRLDAALDRQRQNANVSSACSSPNRPVDSAPMRRMTAPRLLLALLACLAVSMDTATMVLHGLTHEREARALVGMHHPTSQSSCDGSDVEGDHDALHHVASASVLLKVVLAVVPVVSTPTVLVATATSTASYPAVQARPPSRRAGPAQPRAPPLG